MADAGLTRLLAQGGIVTMVIAAVLAAIQISKARRERQAAPVKNTAQEVSALAEALESLRSTSNWQADRIRHLEAELSERDRRLDQMAADLATAQRKLKAVEQAFTELRGRAHGNGDADAPPS
jgi:chromosome segregation ATPase